MIPITKYIIIRELVTKGKVNIDTIEDLLIRKIPINCNLIVVSNPGDLEREIDISVRQINAFTGRRCGGCVVKNGETLELIDTSFCKKTLSKLLSEYTRYNSIDTPTKLAIKIIDACFNEGKI